MYMTHAYTCEAIRALGLVVRCTDGEYRVAAPLSYYARWHPTRAAQIEHQEDEAYYTDDRSDAVNTARIMSVAMDCDTSTIVPAA